MNIVGSMNWRACTDCKYYRPGRGGCQPLDDCSTDLEILHIEYDSVVCDKYQEKEE